MKKGKTKTHKVISKIDKAFKKKLKVKKISKGQPIVVKIKEHTPIPYVSRFFKQEWEEAKQVMFFK